MELIKSNSLKLLKLLVSLIIEIRIDKRLYTTIFYNILLKKVSLLLISTSLSSIIIVSETDILVSEWVILVDLPICVITVAALNSSQQ